MSNTADRASTLHDVAALVGVSPRTVSRVVNDEGGFSAATRERVLDAVAKLRYRPNQLARGLITRRTGTIALVTPVISDPFFPEVADGVQRAAREHGLTMFFATTDDDEVQQSAVLDSIAAHAVDGVIIFPVGESAQQLQRFAADGLPMVSIDAALDDPNACTVEFDLRGGAEQATRHLASRGCRSVGMITSASTPVELRRREQGFLDGLRASGESGSDADFEHRIARVAATIDDGRRGVRLLLEQYPALDGIFAYNDVLAIGAMQVLDELGISVPDDIAVVGCDDIEMSEVVRPSLTTLRLDRELVGREAVRQLVALRDGEATSHRTTLPVTLTVRDSA